MAGLKFYIHLLLLKWASQQLHSLFPLWEEGRCDLREPSYRYCSEQTTANAGVWAASCSCVLAHWWCPMWSFMSSHLSALQLALCPLSLITSAACAFCMTVPSYLELVPQEQIHCSPEDSTVVQAVRVPKSMVVRFELCRIYMEL